MADRTYSAVVPTFQYFLDLVPCRTACPVHTDAGAYVRAIAEWDTARGYAVARAPNPLASICGRICAHPCETKCRRGTIDQPISIRALKRVVTERHGVENPLGAPPAPLRPLGLAAKKGDDVRPGRGRRRRPRRDQLRPRPRAPRLPGDPLRRRAGRGRDAVPGRARVPPAARPHPRRGGPDPGPGRRAALNWRLGRDFSVGDLRRNDYAAVFLALGATRGRELNIPGRELDGVINGVDFLLNANLGYRVALGERVVVVGGGNVAIDVARTVLRYATPETRELPEGAQQLLQTWGYDNAFLDAARTALRLGARHVQLVSLESRSEMPAHPDEVREAEEEGIALVPRRGPKAILGEKGHVAALETLDVESVFDETGRFNPKFVAGQREAPRGRHHHPGRRPAARHRVPLRGSRDHDHAAGPGRGRAAHARDHDARRLLRRRPRLRAAHRDRGRGRRQARRAGDSRARSGGGSCRAPAAASGRSSSTAPADRYDRVPRQTVPTLPVARRTGFREVEEGYTEAQARVEGSRCLWCNVETVFDSERCILCSGCVEICPEACLALVPASRLRGSPSWRPCARRSGPTPAGAIVKDEERCIRCGLCAERCPTGAITMEALELDESPQTALGLFHEGMGEDHDERRDGTRRAMAAGSSS